MEMRMNWEQLLSTETQVKREVEPEDFAKYPMDDLRRITKQLFQVQLFEDCRIKRRCFHWIRVIL